MCLFKQESGEFVPHSTSKYQPEDYSEGSVVWLMWLQQLLELEMAGNWFGEPENVWACVCERERERFCAYHVAIFFFLKQT